MSAPRITGHAKLAGVIGHPVEHSLSPVLHNYWLARHGIDGAYVPLPVVPGSFTTAVRGLQASGFRGANVTIPHKEAAFALADEVETQARIAGSVNTLVFRDDGTIHGSSTDGFGYLASLEAESVSLESLSVRGPALLLGAGGAARSIATSLMEKGMSVIFANRTNERATTLANELAQTWCAHMQSPAPALSTLDWDAWESSLGSMSLLVNTTSLGMQGGPAPEWTPDLSHAAETLVVSDIVYVPRETQLLRCAAARGLKAVGGLGMLLHQARPGFQAWFGAETEVDDATVAHILAVLKNR
ncbi:shikimate dehydrogenase [Acetobacter conturbans]|uniref:Shikimate dehydrogenase (NADP(+)) n=1 Tax=Acetobacter conturbans TaxID=1737472 RepID=A0ABX0JW57_9PROT|nr:shikimate dehydrogenase [Acetobacter conturbans]NHN87461.1 shikimate dehydrogenase [Acetobacter conturbans]